MNKRKKLFIFLLALLLLNVNIIEAKALTLDSPASILQANSQGTHSYDGLLGPLNSPNVRTNNAYVGNITAAVLDKNDNLYVGGTNYYLKSYDKNMNLRWQYYLGSAPAYGVMAIDNNGKLYVARGAGYYQELVAINANNGSLIWRSLYEKKIDGININPVTGDVIVRIVDRNDNSAILGLDSSTGNVKFSYKSNIFAGTNGNSYSPIAIDSRTGDIYAKLGEIQSGYISYLYKLDKNGNYIWKYPYVTQFFGLDEQNNRLYVGYGDYGVGYNQYVRALSLSGSTIWSVNPANNTIRAAAIGKSGDVYAIVYNVLYVYDKNGNLKWKITINSNYASFIIIGSDGIAYVRDAYDYIHAFKDGNLLWKQSLQYSGSMLIKRNGDLVVFGGSYGAFYVYTFSFNGLSTPTGLSITNPTQTSLTISWNSSGREGTVYELYNITKGQVVYSGTGTSYTETGLTPGTTYSYKIRAKNGPDGTYYTSWSSSVSKTTIPATPNTPSGTNGGLSWSQSAGRGYVVLNWDPVPGATGYMVHVWDGGAYRKFDVGNTTTFDTRVWKIYPSESTINSYGTNSRSNDIFYHNKGGYDLRDDPQQLYITSTNNAYNNSHNYWFRVSAYNSSGESPYSDAYMPTLPNRTDATPPTGTLTINDGMTKTGSIDVTLTISGTDPLVSNYTATTSDDASGVAYMSFSNDNVSWSDWEPFATTKEWTLEAGPGTKTVYLKLKDNAGNVSQLISATIYLVDDTTAPSVELLINNGDTTTTNNLVELFINSTDDLTTPADLKFRLSNDGTAWTGWMNYTSVYSDWDLTSGYGGTTAEGYKTVYIQVMDGAGNINTSSATIGYATSEPTGSVASQTGNASSIIVGGTNFTVNFTKSNQIILDVSSADAAEARYSLDGITWSEWEPISSQRSITLESIDGIKGVYVQFRSEYGLKSPIYTKNFVLDTTPPEIILETLTGATATTTGSIDILVVVKDNISTNFTYSLDSSNFYALPADGIITVSGLTSGRLHKITVWVKDEAGNVGTESIDVWSL
ncbi:MAG: fibronectin type III domain-containing protein [Thermosipho sp. (in: Bacteria)]|nr:fibronectin type III domain-containing protein [Thermosipho sp. (in: thermotogales)]